MLQVRANMSYAYLEGSDITREWELTKSARMHTWTSAYIINRNTIDIIAFPYRLRRTRNGPQHTQSVAIRQPIAKAF